MDKHGQLHVLPSQLLRRGPLLPGSARMFPAASGTAAASRSHSRLFMDSPLLLFLSAALYATAASRGAGSRSPWNLTDTSFETPASCMVTPYIDCADSIVFLECVITMNCVSTLISRKQPREATDVGFVQRRVHFVEHAERARLIAENRHQQR